MTAVDHTKDLCDECGAELTVPADPREKPRHECGTLDALVGDYDWDEVFKYATGEWIEDGPPNGARPDQPFTRADVAEIFGSDDGESDGASWIMLGRLKNGLFFFIEASCECTGWGCQESGRSYVSSDLDSLITFGTSTDDRDRLKAPLVALNYRPPKVS